MTAYPLPALQDDAWRLIAGITTLLVLASLVGQVLRIAVARRQPHAVIDNLNRRIGAWWVIAILVGLALVAGRIGVTLLFALASLAALREFVAAEPPGRIPQALLLGSYLLVLPLQYLLVWNGSHLLYGLFIPICVVLVLPMLGRLSGQLRDFLDRTRSLRLGLLSCVYGISYVPALLTLPISGQPGHNNAYLLVYLLLVVQLSDVLQYLWGRLAGRHAIAPQLSPAKTIEGTLGGILSASALGAGLASITPFTVPEAAMVSLLITLLGFLGGLAMSAAKRSRGIKDWSSLIPGHGGMLDRLDSLFLSAPAFFHLLLYGWAT